MHGVFLQEVFYWLENIKELNWQYMYGMDQEITYTCLAASLFA